MKHQALGSFWLCFLLSLCCIHGNGLLIVSSPGATSPFNISSYNTPLPPLTSFPTNPELFLILSNFTSTNCFPSFPQVPSLLNYSQTVAFFSYADAEPYGCGLYQLLEAFDTYGFDAVIVGVGSESYDIYQYLPLSYLTEKSFTTVFQTVWGNNIAEMAALPQGTNITLISELDPFVQFINGASYAGIQWFMVSTFGVGAIVAAILFIAAWKDSNWGYNIRALLFFASLYFFIVECIFWGVNGPLGTTTMISPVAGQYLFWSGYLLAYFAYSQLLIAWARAASHFAHILTRGISYLLIGISHFASGFFLLAVIIIVVSSAFSSNQMLLLVSRIFLYYVMGIILLIQAIGYVFAGGKLIYVISQGKSASSSSKIAMRKITVTILSTVISFLLIMIFLFINFTSIGSPTVFMISWILEQMALLLLFVSLIYAIGKLATFKKTSEQGGTGNENNKVSVVDMQENL